MVLDIRCSDMGVEQSPFTLRRKNHTQSSGSPQVIGHLPKLRYNKVLRAAGIEYLSKAQIDQLPRCRGHVTSLSYNRTPGYYAARNCKHPALAVYLAHRSSGAFLTA